MLSLADGLLGWVIFSWQGVSVAASVQARHGAPVLSCPTTTPVTQVLPQILTQAE